MGKNIFKVCSVFDTETCNLTTEHKAFVVCYIVNDLRDKNLTDYRIEESDDIRFYHTQAGMLEYIDDLILYGFRNKCIPIVCAYNLMFDLQSLLGALSDKYIMRCIAQSSTHVYAMDLLDEKGRYLLRFWDTYFLDIRGLAAMGASCGVAKLRGDWDYDLIRTPFTPLTDEEYGYARRDVQVIPAYLQWLISSNEFVTEKDLGVKILTKTSIVRTYAKNSIGKMKRGRMTLNQDYSMYTKDDIPKDYTTYALRRACFRGGLTFTAANTALQPMHNVASIDVTSMHHTYINHLMPKHFKQTDRGLLEYWMHYISHLTFDDLLNRYDNPFNVAFHVCVEVKNVELKSNTCFEKYGIATLSEAKFKVNSSIMFDNNEASELAEKTVKERGFMDVANGAHFAFSKLMSCDYCRLFLNEVEWFIFTHVYDYSKYRVMFGEISEVMTTPCDYVTLQSNRLYLAKSQVKDALKACAKGESYSGPLPDMMPPGYASELREGTCDYESLNSWYTSTLKGMFNGIYGVQAQDVYKPDFEVVGGVVSVDKTTVVNDENFAQKDVHGRVIYTYGMRIVGWSRLHLITAIYLLDKAFGKRVDVLGGDTDSLKVRCDLDVTDADLMQALQPLHDACDKSKAAVIGALKRRYSDIDDMTDVGHFEVEKCGKESTRHELHMELWNKARISIDDGRAVITCAGVSRGKEWYDLNDAISDLLPTLHDEKDLQNLFGFNLLITYDLCRSLERNNPKPHDRYTGTVTDYLGDSYDLDLPQAVCLYPSDRMIGDVCTLANAGTVSYLRGRGFEVNDELRIIGVRDGKPYLETL